MNEQPGQRLPARLLWTPIAFLIFGLLVTMGATLTLAEANDARGQLRFAYRVAETRAAIQERVHVHISLLRGVAGLYAAGGEVDRATFRAYVDRLALAQNYPGVQAVGFAARVPEDEAAFVAQVREEAFPEFTIWPAGARAERYPIALIEPLDQRNRRAVGYDMFSEPVRRETMARARDTGVAAATGAVTLVQELESDAKQAGFLIYLPVYEGGITPTSVPERRERIVGFAYSPFRVGDLLGGIFGDSTQLRVAFTIYDGGQPSPDALLFRSAHLGGPNYRPAYTTAETLNVAGRQWTVVYASQPSFDASGEPYIGPMAAAAGTILSLILFGVAWAQARARYDAELAVRARETFLSVASHELKTPLTSLFGNAQLLQRRAARSGRIGERERANIGVIVAQSRRLTKLIDDLLDHTRLQEGRFAIQREPLELADVVRLTVEELRPTLQRHSISLALPDEPLPIIGDASRLEQVLVNLIGNAVKYSPAGGPVEVQVARAGGCATVTVLDRGIGIPAAALAELGRPFFRAPNAVSRQISGMGIGLYVVKELIERHGGSLAISSEEGVGSAFTVCLPLLAGDEGLSVPAHRRDPQVSQRP
jgi:signal transduction histidine kinase